MTGASRRRQWGWFAAWLLVGATVSLSVLSMLTIGILVVPVAVAGTVLLARARSTRPGLPGLVSGFGLPPLYVAFINRSGPGNICHSFSGGGEECVQQFSPWPWLAAAVLLALAGIAVFVLASSGSRSRSV